MNKNAPYADDFDEAAEERFSLSVNGVADFLSMRGAKPTVALLSPSGDDGSTASVMLARSIAELGRSVVVVDMTSSGYPTQLMAQEAGLAGVSDLLFGETPFGETIHHDRLSNAHIVPQGKAQPLHTMRIIQRLTMVLHALADTYDTVLLEFGSADIEGVTKLLKYIDAEIVLSLPDGDKPLAIETLLELRALGYADVVMMSESYSGDRTAA
ncbi:tyrosine-protein kinase family protein [Agrobacterium rosae]|uniref:Tyrosine-protein kinase family protein n=1 Tax=Agrobacterium rosae TaxID=1972867 RepID=A0AAW9FCD8_9HYPH|nr:tyrosine-protein kinase family protein [Agrobacterium rosae]MDX8300670.1 tyrosine-protein kinase family protein [Agrobacterium rosae]